ncbi:Sedoheptulose-1 family protein [Salix suchowensis]|nr:Sedoheptulose-1 family protein [Salix suchowensis]
METGLACSARGWGLLLTWCFSAFKSSKSEINLTIWGDVALRTRIITEGFEAKNSSLVTRCEIGDSLEEFLAKATSDKGLIRVMMCMGEALRTITFKALSKYACSEEVPELQDMGGQIEGGFSFAFDPLDGPSIVDTNFSVGTIFGVDQVAAAMGVYGLRTTYVLALKDYPGTTSFFFLMKITVKGVFTNVISPSSKAKLRLLFEVAPLGFLVEKAGGYSSDGYRSVLDKEIINLDDRTQVAYGSKNEIIRFEETLNGKSRLKAEGVPVGAAA